MNINTSYAGFTTLFTCSAHKSLDRKPWKGPLSRSPRLPEAHRHLKLSRLVGREGRHWHRGRRGGCGRQRKNSRRDSKRRSHPRLSRQHRPGGPCRGRWSLRRHRRHPGLKPAPRCRGRRRRWLGGDSLLRCPPGIGRSRSRRRSRNRLRSRNGADRNHRAGKRDRRHLPRRPLRPLRGGCRSGRGPPGVLRARRRGVRGRRRRRERDRPGKCDRRRPPSTPLALRGAPGVWRSRRGAPGVVQSRRRRERLLRCRDGGPGEHQRRCRRRRWDRRRGGDRRRGREPRVRGDRRLRRRKAVDRPPGQVELGRRRERPGRGRRGGGRHPQPGPVRNTPSRGTAYRTVTQVTQVVWPGRPSLRLGPQEASACPDGLGQSVEL